MKESACFALATYSILATVWALALRSANATLARAATTKQEKVHPPITTAGEGEKKMKELAGPQGTRPVNQEESDNPVAERHRQERTDLNQRHAKEIINLLGSHHVEREKLRTRHDHEAKGGRARSDSEILND